MAVTAFQDLVHIASHRECFVYYVLSQKRMAARWGFPSDEALRY